MEAEGSRAGSVSPDIEMVLRDITRRVIAEIVGVFEEAGRLLKLAEPKLADDAERQAIAQSTLQLIEEAIEFIRHYVEACPPSLTWLKLFYCLRFDTINRVVHLMGNVAVMMRDLDTTHPSWPLLQKISSFEKVIHNIFDRLFIGIDIFKQAGVFDPPSPDNSQA